MTSFFPSPEPSFRPPTPTTPEATERTTLLRPIGVGGMAEIFLAETKTGFGISRPCVVKRILPMLACDRDFSAMLIREAKLASTLSHPNIVQVFDLIHAHEGEASPSLAIVMEHVDGLDLGALWRRCAQEAIRLPNEFAIKIVCDTLRGLDHAHKRTGKDGSPLGIVHRDVSPSNILISFDGEVKVCDFGIAHANDTIHLSSRILDDALQGKAGYMSPEHARGEPVDARADVFATSIVLWELVHGERFYPRRADRLPPLEQARAADLPLIDPLGFPSSDRLRDILERGLRVDPNERYPSADAMLRDLDTYARDAQLTVTPTRLGRWLAGHFGASNSPPQTIAVEPIDNALEVRPPVDADQTPSKPQRIGRVALALLFAVALAAAAFLMNR